MIVFRRGGKGHHLPLWWHHCGESAQPSSWESTWQITSPSKPTPRPLLKTPTSDFTPYVSRKGRPPCPAPHHLLQRHCCLAVPDPGGEAICQDRFHRVSPDSEICKKDCLSPPPLCGDFLWSHCCMCRAVSVIRDCHHYCHSLFLLLPSGKRYRSLHTKPTRMLHSFSPQAVRTINKLCPPCLPPPSTNNVK